MSLQSIEKIPKGAGWKAVYDTLRVEILSLRLAPGQLLDETSLATRFRMSRSPIREALIRLAGDELVVPLPNRSTIVAPINISGFPRYIEALDIAQRVTTRLAAEHRTQTDLKTIARRQREYRGALKRGNHLEISEANEKFHMEIAVAGRNIYLSNFYERLLTLGRRMLHMHFEYMKRPANGYLLTDEHDELLAAIEGKDVDRADSLAHEHTRQFQNQFVEYMQENYVTNVSFTHVRDAG